MKTNYFLLVLLLISTVAFGQRKFRSVEKTSMYTKDYLLGNSPDSTLTPVNFEAFEVSELVTWKDYKLFLAEVKRTKGDYYFNIFLPDAPKDYVNEALHTKKHDKDVVTGVSWIEAVEYCYWKTVYDNELTFEFTYQIPTLDEWLLLHRDFKGKLDIDEGITEWTLTSMNENMLNSKSSSAGYVYYATEWDPQAMKRKIAIGSSENSSSNKLSDCLSKVYYQDSTYSHIGFRVLKKANEDYKKEYQTWMCDYINRYDSWIFGDPKDINTQYGRIEYSQSNGKLNGLYVSYYENGTVKAFGNFLDNERLGTWVIHDTLGEVVQERYYTGLNSFLITRPNDKDKNDGSKNSNAYFSSRNADGLINLRKTPQDKIAFSQRYIVALEEENNKAIFAKNAMYNIVENGLDNGTLSCFDTLDFQHVEPISSEEMTSRMRGKAIRFELHGQFIYDKELNGANHKIIAICPVVYDSTTNSEVSIGWIPYVQLRPLLRNIYISDVQYNASPLEMKNFNGPQNQMFPANLDDHFVKGNYSSMLIKVFDADRFGAEILNLREPGPFYHIELEHELWLNYDSE